MPVHVSWLNEDQSALVYQCEGSWTWEEVWQAFSVGEPMLESSPHPTVDVIVDLTRGNGVPDGAKANIRDLTLQASEKWGLGIIVGDDAMTQQLMYTLSRIYRRLGERYRQAKTMEEARSILEEHRTT
jgi:hypothetical protein